MPKVVRTIVIEHSLWEEIKRKAYNEGVTISHIIETALRDYLKQQNQEK